ncbi:cupin domain-containing protein [uncultured Ferrovibrio sp.]|jgi:Uncharacterized conserved protein, contains double-stranded beta-helix domain|uniref:cupin domain-containing protein n=1 Tax=uncultured Ferrovibrio sp. TaxID=1576913 RepID=UPI002611B82C|nr:cupin domain-containing protein [uncultured Ferrovibrio sp.]
MPVAKRQKQKFHVNRAKDATFASDGLRAFFVYRDLGIAEATNGRFNAEVIRAKEASQGGTGRHYHKLDFQMVYMLKGWAKFDYEGEGTYTFKAGDCFLQPPEIRHELIAFSKDVEMLEITSPAGFETVSASAPAPAIPRRRSK